MNPETNELNATGGEAAAYRYLVVALLALVYTMSFLDRQILSILAEPIKAELKLSDTQLGMLSGLFFAAFYSVLGVPLAWVADRTNRVRLVAIVCLLWSLFSGACGLAANFTQLALARMGVAIGEAGGQPPSYSIIADYFPPRQRGTAISLYSLGAPLGTAIGAAFGGWLASLYGWRVAFYATAAPGVVLALALVLFVREPKRGRQDGAAADAAQPSLWFTFKMFGRSPILFWTTAGAALSTVVGYGMLSWSAAFLIREKGMTMPEIAMYYSVATGLSVGAGMLISGWLVDRYGARDKRAYGLIPAIAFAAAIPFFIGMLLAPSWQLSLWLMVVPCAMYTMWLSPALATIQNSVLPNQRGTSSAMLLMISGLFGLTGGPLVVGWVSDMATAAGSTEALTIGMAALTPAFALAALAHLMTARAHGRAA